LQYNKKAKDTLKAFLEAVPKMDEKRLYNFVLYQFTKVEAQIYVHRMRVELSRMRGMIKQKGMTIKEFKIMLEGIEERQGNAHVTLRYKDEVNQILSQNITEIFNALSDGSSRVNIAKIKQPAANSARKLNVKIN